MSLPPTSIKDSAPASARMGSNASRTQSSSALRAAMIRSTRAGRPARRKRRNQGSERGNCDQLTWSGLRASKSMPGTFRMSPGSEVGRYEDNPMLPALPNEQASPGASRSAKVTSNPVRRR